MSKEKVGLKEIFDQIRSMKRIRKLFMYQHAKNTYQTDSTYTDTLLELALVVRTSLTCIMATSMLEESTFVVKKQMETTNQIYNYQAYALKYW